MGETGWKDEQIFSKQQESLWMEGTTRAEPGGQRCVQPGVDSREHGGMVRGPYGRQVAQEVAGAEGRAEGPGFWFCRLWDVGACSDGCELGGHYGSRAVHCTGAETGSQATAIVQTKKGGACVKWLEEELRFKASSAQKSQEGLLFNR